MSSNNYDYDEFKKNIVNIMRSIDMHNTHVYVNTPYGIFKIRKLYRSFNFTEMSLETFCEHYDNVFQNISTSHIPVVVITQNSIIGIQLKNRLDDPIMIVIPYREFVSDPLTAFEKAANNYQIIIKNKNIIFIVLSAKYNNDAVVNSEYNSYVQHMEAVNKYIARTGATRVINTPYGLIKMTAIKLNSKSNTEE